MDDEVQNLSERVALIEHELQTITKNTANAINEISSNLTTLSDRDVYISNIVWALLDKTLPDMAKDLRATHGIMYGKPRS